LISTIRKADADVLPGLRHKLYESKFAGPVNRDIQVQLAFCRPDFGNVDVEVAERIGIELLFVRLVAFDLRQPRNVMTLQAAMKRGSR
jgi:hypothetical protein